MIQGLLVGVQVGRRWLRPAWRMAQSHLPARWRRDASLVNSAPGVVEAPELLVRLEEETDAIVERALARSIETPAFERGSRTVRLGASTVSHVARNLWRVGLRADEATALAAAGSLREVDARFVEAMARTRDIGDAPSTPAFQRRLALLEVVSDAAHPGLRSEHELDRQRRARMADEVARRRQAMDAVGHLERELSSHHEHPFGAIFVTQTRALVRRQWVRLSTAPLAADELCGGAKELAAVCRHHLDRGVERECNPVEAGRPAPR